MSEKAHSEIGPSAADRWIHCPASVQLSRGIPSKDTKFTHEGTIAHLAAEVEACRAFHRPGPTEALVAQFTAEMTVGAAFWAGFLQGQFQGAQGFPEQGIDLEATLGAPAFGTTDFAAVGGYTDGVADYKFGKGVKVKSEGNSQLLLYAAGVWETIGLGELAWNQTRQVVLAIVQPRVTTTVSRVVVDWGLVLDWTREVARPAAQKALSEDPGQPVPGPWCRWCPARTRCPAQVPSELAEILGLANPHKGGKEH